MGMSAAERARKYRQNIKSDPLRYSQYLQKEKERFKKRKTNGERPSIKTLPEREARKMRRKWRKEKRDSKERKKKTAEVMFTPPASPETQGPSESEQKKRGRRKVKKERLKVYRRNKKLEAEIVKAQRDKLKFKKRWQRLKKKTEEKITNMRGSNGKSNNTEITQETESPRSALKHQLQGVNVPKDVKKKLLFNSAVVMELREKMRQEKSEKGKQVISKMISGSILKKYRLLKYTQSNLGISRSRLQSNKIRSHQISYERAKKKNSVSIELRRQVQAFLEEDCNSKIMPGKRDTITRKLMKKQKRLLCDNLINLHKKFAAEHPLMVISYQTFCRLRPFWVIEPNCSGRDTCSCKIHDNVKFLVDRLVDCKVLDTNNLNEVCAKVCCDVNNKACMYGECGECADSRLSFPKDSGINENMQVWVHKWVNKTEERNIEKPNGDVQKINVQVTVKEKEHMLLHQLLDETSQSLKGKFCRHAYNTFHQYNVLKNLKNDMCENETIVHIDFSENYACKMAEEVQSMHFGASRHQVSLHTGVYYTISGTNSFCTIAKSTRHDPAAIWAHLDPVLKELKGSNPQIDTIHVVSDGPTSQYRSRKNFHLFKVRIHALYGFKYASWNFSESGHGKGAPDGIGATIKRSADKLVGYGRDIPDVDVLFQELSKIDLSVKLYLIPEDAMHAIDITLPDRIMAVPGTMSLHQVLSKSDQTAIKVRCLSCFCKRPQECECFAPKEIHYAVCEDTSRKQIDMMNPDNDSDKSSGQVSHSDASLSASSSGLISLQQEPDQVGKWCVVEYDGRPYPGIIQDIDHDSVEVKTMHCIGKNRFFWPLIDDVIWYVFQRVITMIPEPNHVTKRHVQIEPGLWTTISNQLDLD